MRPPEVVYPFRPSRLRALMKERGLTGHGLSALMGRSRGYIANLLRRARIPEDTLRKMAAALGMTSDDLYAAIGPAPPSKRPQARPGHRARARAHHSRSVAISEWRF